MSLSHPFILFFNFSDIEKSNYSFSFTFMTTIHITHVLYENIVSHVRIKHKYIWGYN